MPKTRKTKPMKQHAYDRNQLIKAFVHSHPALKGFMAELAVDCFLDGVKMYNTPDFSVEKYLEKKRLEYKDLMVEASTTGLPPFEPEDNEVILVDQPSSPVSQGVSEFAVEDVGSSDVDPPHE